ncbi:MAG: DUF1343 domain-containing protein [Bacteroidota bacterium]
MSIYFSFKNTVLWIAVVAVGLLSCDNLGRFIPRQHTELIKKPIDQDAEIVVAANRTEAYLPLLRNQKIGVVANHTSVIFKPQVEQQNKLAYTHLVDSLLAHNMNITKVFAPEHGFRGSADAGEKVKDGKDPKTGLPIISLYGNNRKPSPEQLAGLDLILFDIQDVGVRFYTYIATLQLVMEACAEANIPIIVLDRPNPNGHYVDGPSMLEAHTSFLGMNEIPLVYGMTIGEYAQMVNGEGWLATDKPVSLTVIPLANYSHTSAYTLPIRPSPNLPNAKAINLYPSLGLFEGTHVNAGRGTEYQFQRYGASFLDSAAYTFQYTPKPNFGAKYPKQEGKLCFGKDLSNHPDLAMVSLEWLMEAYANCTDKTQFFKTDGFTKHAGTPKLQQQIEAGLPKDSIIATWQPEITAFRKIRKRYLIYD